MCVLARSAYLPSRVQLIVTSWTVARQAPLSMEFLRQEYWGLDCRFLLQGIFLIQGSTHVSCKSCIGRQILYHYTTWEAHISQFIHIYVVFAELFESMFQF